MRVAVLEQLCNERLMLQSKLSQARVDARRIAVPGGLNGLEDRVRNAGHCRYHNDDPVFCGGRPEDFGTLPEPLRIAHGGAAKLHHDQPLSPHLLAPISLVTFTTFGAQVTIDPWLSAEVISASV